jgi:hypothetical protein
MYMSSTDCWEVFRGVEELVNVGDRSILERLHDEYGHEEDEWFEYSECGIRLQRLIEYCGKISGDERVQDIVAEMFELTCTDDKLKALKIVEGR